MTKQNITAWFLEGGSVSIPKHLLTFMEPLGLNFDDLGKMVYLLYCGADQIKRDDQYAQDAARTLHAKGLIHWFTDTETIDFTPMFDRISMYLGDAPQHMEPRKEDTPESTLSYGEMLKNIERKFGYFLTVKDRDTIQEVIQRYSWSYDLVQELFMVHYEKQRKECDFKWFCRMAYGAQVHDKKSLKEFVESLDTITYKTMEVLRRLGKRNNPSEPQKEMYLKWSGMWKFTHEMILLAVEDTTGASNPSFNYLDGILSSWKERGITTPEALEAEKQRQQTAKAQERGDKYSSGGSGSARRKGAIPKYDTQKVDLSFLER